MIIGQHHKTSIMLSAVTHIQRTVDWKRAIVHRRDGESETYDATDVDSALENTAQASWPANGASLVETTYDEKGKPDGVWLQQIIGFYLDAAGEIRAVTLDGNHSECTIMFADGHVEQFEGRWDTLEDYKRHVLENAKPRRLIGE